MRLAASGSLSAPEADLHAQPVGVDNPLLTAVYRLFYNEKRYSDGARLLTDHFINHHHGAEGVGRQLMIDNFSRAARNFPNFRIETKRMVEEGAFVWTHGLITGLPNQGRAASVDIWRFEDGKIAEHWDVGQALSADQDANAII